MSEARLVDPGEVVMTGENSFIRLSDDAGKTLIDRVSHWRVLWSPAGQGHALFIDSPLTGAGPRVYSDNIGMTRYLQRRIETLLHAPFGDESLPVVDAEFVRSGNCLATLEERISSDDGQIVLAWWDLLPAFVITVPPGQMIGRSGSTAPSSRRAARNSRSMGKPRRRSPSRRIDRARPRRAASWPGRRPG